MQDQCQIPKEHVLFMGHCSRGRSTRVSATGGGDLSPPRLGEAKLLGHWVSYGATTVLAEHCQVLLWERQLFLVLSQMLNTSAVPRETSDGYSYLAVLKESSHTQGQAPETRWSSSAWRLSVVISHPRSSLLHLPFLNS